MPPRGPRSVLCVVVVTTSATPIGEGCAPPAMRPGDVRDVGHEDGADLVGDLGERAKSIVRGIRGAAAQSMSFGALLARELAHLVEVDAARCPRDAVRHGP